MNTYQDTLGKIENLFSDKLTMVHPRAKRYENVLGLNWNNSLAIKRVYEISALLNRNPDIVGVDKGQSVTWFNPKTKSGDNNYERIEVHDKIYYQPIPVHHGNFVFLYVTLPLKPEKAIDINKITTSVFYFPPGNLVGASNHFLGGCIAAISTVKDYNDCKISLDQGADIYRSRFKDLYLEFEKSEMVDDIRSYETPLRDILEEYILSPVSSHSSLPASLATTTYSDITSFENNLELGLSTLGLTTLEQDLLETEPKELEPNLELEPETKEPKELRRYSIFRKNISPENNIERLPSGTKIIVDNNGDNGYNNGDNNENRLERTTSYEAISDNIERLPSGTKIIVSNDGDNNELKRTTSYKAISDNRLEPTTSYKLVDDSSLPKIFKSESRSVQLEPTTSYKLVDDSSLPKISSLQRSNLMNNSTNDIPMSPTVSNTTNDFSIKLSPLPTNRRLVKDL